MNTACISCAGSICNVVKSTTKCHGGNIVSSKSSHIADVFMELDPFCRRFICLGGEILGAYQIACDCCECDRTHRIGLTIARCDMVAACLLCRGLSGKCRGMAEEQRCTRKRRRVTHEQNVPAELIDADYSWKSRKRMAI